MQEIHSTDSIKILKEVFFSLINVDVEKLKKIPAFVEIQNLVLQNTTA